MSVLINNVEMPKTVDIPDHEIMACDKYGEEWCNNFIFWKVPTFEEYNRR